MDESLDSSIYTQERESDMEDLNDSTDVEIIEPARLPHSPPSNPAATPSVPQPLRSGQTSSYSPSPKRRRNEETENLPKPSISNLNETSMEEGEVCSVCFEPYETMGKHRLACLKCGHLFGHSCIERWLPVGSKGGSCPQCKKKATRKDIRIIYAKGVRVADNSEAEWTKQELEAVRSEKRLIEMELAEVRLKLQTQIELNSSLQSRLQTVSQIDSVSFAGPSRSAHVAQSNMGSIGFRLLKTIEFSKDSECRVMDFCPDMSLLVCSQVCVNALFPGHGVKKV